MPFKFRILAAIGVCAATVSVLAQSTLPDVILRASTAPVVSGQWRVTADPTAAGGFALRHPDAGAAKLAAPLASPVNYFELTFDAQAATAYRLWIRGRADANSWANDSVFAQFSGSVTSTGTPQFRIGSTSATILTVEDCNGCGVSGWGWQDNGYGAGVLGPPIYFAADGTQTLRIQTREDGLSLDQIVLSPARYLTTAPGATRNDTTILPTTGPETATLVRGPYLQRASATAVRILWATLESGQGQVRYARRPNGGSLLDIASTRLVSRTVTGLAYDYYHHEATLEGLAASTEYEYQLFVDANPAGTPGATHVLRTAPATGSGAVAFIAFGDSGTGSTEQRQLAALMAADTFDLALHTGDIAYGNSGGTGDATWRTFHDWFFGIYGGWLPRWPFFPSEGNHDSRPTNGNGRAYLDVFSLPTNGASTGFPDHAERYYSFDWGPVHFVALDTAFAFQDLTRRAEQLAWLEVDLAATSQPWKIAYFHRSPFSAGGEHGSDLAVRNAFSPLFERYGVQLAISAHEHDYERTRPQAVAGGPPVVYVVSGGGGAPLYPAATAAWTAYSASRHHYVRAVVEGCTLSLAAIGLNGAVFDSTTVSRCQPPPSSDDVVLYAADVVATAGAWTSVSDPTAAAGVRLRHPDAGAAKMSGPLAAPQHYVEFTFDASAGIPYHLWIRGRADANSWANDSVYVQFSGAIDTAGRPVYAIGTTNATTMTLEDCSGCGLSGWGWQDNGFGGLGPAVTFAVGGPQRIRIQTREDGLSFDQILLSPERYLTASPGALRNDTVIVPKVQ